MAFIRWTTKALKNKGALTNETKILISQKDSGTDKDYTTTYKDIKDDIAAYSIVQAVNTLELVSLDYKILEEDNNKVFAVITDETTEKALVLPDYRLLSPGWKIVIKDAGGKASNKSIKIFAYKDDPPGLEDQICVIDGTEVTSESHYGIATNWKTTTLMYLGEEEELPGIIKGIFITL
jgi:hypothetical protein